jgi:protein SCO1/2
MNPFLLKTFSLFMFLSFLINAPAAGTGGTNGYVGFEEKQGAYLPLDLPFVNEKGERVMLGDVIKGPTILTFVYYNCPNECDFLITGLAEALRPYTKKPGGEPNLVTITIDDRETVADAQRAKEIAIESIQEPYPEEKWHFLTGGPDSIRKAADAAGFRYARAGSEFNHPVGLIVVSPKGEIIRYIIGADILPMDLEISLMEASSGTVSPTVARVIRLCFSYDPKSHLYVFNILQVSATTIFLIIGGFVLYLFLSGRRKQKSGVK